MKISLGTGLFCAGGSFFVDKGNVLSDSSIKKMGESSAKVGIDGSNNTFAIVFRTGKEIFVVLLRSRLVPKWTRLEKALVELFVELGSVTISAVGCIEDVEVVGGALVAGVGRVSGVEFVGFRARFVIFVGGFSSGAGSPFGAGLGCTVDDFLSWAGGKVN